MLLRHMYGKFCPRADVDCNLLPRLDEGPRVMMNVVPSQGIKIPRGMAQARLEGEAFPPTDQAAGPSRKCRDAVAKRPSIIVEGNCPLRTYPQRA